MISYVGLNGPSGVGKDTTAKALVAELNNLGIASSIGHISDPYYAVVSVITGKSMEWLHDRKNKDTVWTSFTAPQAAFIGKTPREVLQFIGKTLRVQYGHQFSIEKLKAKAVKEKSIIDSVGGYKHLVVLVPDVRYPDEPAQFDMTIGLARAGCEFARDHEAECPLLPEMIDRTFDLHHAMNYSSIAHYIAERIGVAT